MSNYYMEDNKLDKLFREKLASHSTPFDGKGEMWNSISSSLDNINSGIKKPSRVISKRKILYYSASAVAAVIAGIYLFAPNSNQPHISDINEKSVLAKYQPIEKKQDNVAALTKAQTLTIQTSTNNQAKDSITTTLYVAEFGDILSAEPQKEGLKTEEEPKKSDSVRNITANYIANLYDELLEEDKDIKAKKSIINIGIASNIISGRSMDGAANNLRHSMMASGVGMPQGMPAIEQVSDTKYSLPINFALQMQIKLNSYLSVGTGVSYTMLRSKYDGMINKQMNSVRQTLHYIGIPINFYGTLIQKNNFYAYANIGTTIEKGLRAVYSVKSYDQSREYGSSIEGMQYSINFGVGLEYRFIKHIGVYLEPNAVYFFDSKVPNSIRTDQPFQLKAEIGFRFHF